MDKINLDDLVYHIGYKCNLSCRGCVNYSNHLEAHALPWNNNWHTELSKLNDRFSVRHLEIIGGEPLQHPDIQKLITFACSLDIKYITLSTNGLLLSENVWLKELCKSVDNLEVRVSYHHSPLIDNKYNSKMCKSLSEFFDINYSKMKKILCRVFVSTETESIKNLTPETENFTITLKDNFILQDPPYWKYPELDINEIPIKYNNDPEQAYNDCLCPWLHYVDGKIYKCAMTGTLPQVLKLKDNIDDWPLLKNYMAYNVLADHDKETFERLTGHEDVCKYCPVAGQWQYDKTDSHSKILKVIG